MIRILLSTRLGEKRWTQAELAAKANVRAGTIGKMFHEMSDRISLHDLDKICQVLECDISDILVRDGRNPLEEDDSEKA
mgnify:CR=1 FL=1